MSGGEIAGIIFAGGFALLVLFLGFPLLRLGRVLSEVAKAVEAMNEELTPLVSEARETLLETNKQLRRIDNITKDVEQISANANSIFALFTASIGGPLAKISGLVSGFLTSEKRRRGAK